MSAQSVIQVRAPSVYTAESSRLAGLIELAEPYLNLVETEYVPLRDQGIAYLVLHWIKKEEWEGQAGRVIEEKEGDLSKKYAASSDDDEDYSLTYWGGEFLGIRRKIALLPAPEVEDEE